jgi:hypothetical protein
MRKSEVFEVGMRKAEKKEGEKLGRWEGEKVGLEVGSRNAEVEKK